MSKYSLNKIFLDSTVNAILDRMYYEIETAAPVADLDAVFALTGKAAALLQAGTDGSVNNIVFITNDLDLIAFCLKTLPRLVPHKGMVKFATRAIFYFEGFVVEIWYVAGVIGITEVDNIYVQETAKINPDLL